MSAPAPSLDIVTVMIAAATWAVGSEAAQIIGPYSVIILGAIGGATWSASSRVSETRWEALRYVLWMVGLALTATVPLAYLIANYTGLAPHWMFAPLAVVIAARPDWVISRVRAVFDKGQRP